MSTLDDSLVIRKRGTKQRGSEPEQESAKCTQYALRDKLCGLYGTYTDGLGELDEVKLFPTSVAADAYRQIGRKPDAEDVVKIELRCVD